MKSALFLCAALAVLAGCKKDEPPKGAPADVAPREVRVPQPVSPPTPGTPGAPDASAGGADGPSAEEEKLTLSKTELDAFVTYQRRRQELFTALIGELGKLQAKADAGKYEGTIGGVGAMKDVVAITEKQAEAEEKARKESGMEAEKLERVEELVSAVISKRMVAKTLNQDQMITDMEKMRANVPAESKQEFDESIAQMKAQADELKTLKEERARFGAANVELVLSREGDLLADYEKWLGVAAGGKP